MTVRSLAIAGVALILGAAPAAVALSATHSTKTANNCPGGLPQGAADTKLDPASFSTRIDNPYWPMRPGSTWVFRETDRAGSELRIKVVVTNRTKVVANGIKARVVTDVVSEDGKAVEVTEDWYAQDRRGNVWYLGEQTAEYENGKAASTAGSWEAGVDGAQAGVAVPAHPVAGLCYREEYYAGEAEDAAKVLSTVEQAEVPAGHFANVLLTKNFSPVEPRVLEYKLYAKGVGPVLALSVSGGGGGREELLRTTRGR